MRPFFKSCLIVLAILLVFFVGWHIIDEYQLKCHFEAIEATPSVDLMRFQFYIHNSPYYGDEGAETTYDIITSQRGYIICYFDESHYETGDNVLSYIAEDGTLRTLHSYTEVIELLGERYIADGNTYYYYDHKNGVQIAASGDWGSRDSEAGAAIISKKLTKNDVIQDTVGLVSAYCGPLVSILGIVYSIVKNINDDTLYTLLTPGSSYPYISLKDSIILSILWMIYLLPVIGLKTTKNKRIFIPLIIIEIVLPLLILWFIIINDPN